MIIDLNKVNKAVFFVRSLIWFLLIALFSFVISGCNGGSSGSGSGAPASPTLVSLAIKPNNPVVHLGTQLQLTATATYSNGDAKSITSEAIWSSSSESVALVSNAAGSAGEVTPFKAGTSKITATMDGISSVTTLTVSTADLQSITITPESPTTTLGTPVQFTAIGNFKDSIPQDVTLSATWTSSNLAVAKITISPNTVKAVPEGVGTSIVTATLDSISANTSLTVTSAVVVPTTLLSAYKDVGTSMNWYDPAGINTNVMFTYANTKNTGVYVPVVNALPAGMNTVTWAFAVGVCSNENWAAMPYSQFGPPNVTSFSNANVNYILGTGGLAGKFTCNSKEDLKAFLDRYNSKNLLGIDFDIENGAPWSQSDVTNLVNSIAQLKQFYSQYANLRVSFTLQTLADSTSNQASLNSLGEAVLNAINVSGLQGYYINLMTMYFTGVGQADPNVCVVKNNKCDMGASSIQAAENLHAVYGIPFDHIEITPEIGQNDDVYDEVFTLSDATTVANYVRDNKLGGLHYWSFDRDAPCVAYNGNVPDDDKALNNLFTVCNNYTTASDGVLPFANAFINGLQ